MRRLSFPACRISEMKNGVAQRISEEANPRDRFRSRQPSPYTRPTTRIPEIADGSLTISSSRLPVRAISVAIDHLDRGGFSSLGCPWILATIQ